MREADYRVRALEVHSLYAWDFAWMKKVLEYIDRLGYNTLIVHRNDIVESLEYPGAIFGYDNLYSQLGTAITNLIKAMFKGGDQA